MAAIIGGFLLAICMRLWRAGQRIALAFRLRFRSQSRFGLRSDHGWAEFCMRSAALIAPGVLAKKRGTIGLRWIHSQWGEAE